ncbi:MAG: hypothetical protein ACE5OZ_10705 [Candidatus Heimdallarchaeota archaeon]
MSTTKTLVFPNVSISDEGKTISSIFFLDFIEFLMRRKIGIIDVKVVSHKLVLMENITPGHLSSLFKDYLQELIDYATENLSRTRNFLRRDNRKEKLREKDLSDIEQVLKTIDPFDEIPFTGLTISELYGLFPLNKMYKALSKGDRCVLLESELRASKKPICPVCSLPRERQSTLTHRISLSSQKYLPRYAFYKSSVKAKIKGCDKCEVLSYLSSQFFEWRQVIGFAKKRRHSLVIRLNLPGLFEGLGSLKATLAEVRSIRNFFSPEVSRVVRGGTTSFDLLLNFLRQYPLFANTLRISPKALDFLVLTEISEQGVWVPRSVVPPEKTHLIATFAFLLTRFFPDLPQSNQRANKQSDNIWERQSHIISEAGFDLCEKNASEALERFFFSLMHAGGVKVHPEVMSTIVTELNR